MQNLHEILQLFIILCTILGLPLIISLSISHIFDKEPLTQYTERVTMHKLDQCKPHIWAELLLTTKKAYIANPTLEGASPTKYCAKCGYVPDKEVFIKPKYLVSIQIQILISKYNYAVELETNNLETDFFNEIGEIAKTDAFKKGYKAKARFEIIKPIMLRDKILKNQELQALECEINTLNKKLNAKWYKKLFRKA